MRIFISGGCKNGKSYYAQRLAKAQAAERLYYIATMRPSDEEDRERILRHRAEREGWGFITLELQRDIGGYEGIRPGDSILLDSVTALLANEMFQPDGGVNPQACTKVRDDLLALLERSENIVFVSDYIFSDAFIYDELTEKYREGLAYVDRALAKACDTVLEAVYGNIVVHKGSMKILNNAIDE